MSSLRLALPYLACVALAAGLAGEVVGLRTNTLEANGHWHSAKLDLERPVMGAVSFLVTPIALHRNRLDLSSWHGFQEIAWHEDIDLERIALRFRLDEFAHLTLRYGGIDDASGGLRLSRHPNLPSRELITTDGTRVVQARPVELSLDAGWHEATVTLGARPHAEVDGRPLPLSIGIGAGPKRFALRGSGYPTLVDDVRLELRDGTVLREDFRRAGGLRRAGLLAVAMLVAIELAVRVARARERRAWWMRIAISLALCLIAGLAWTAQTLVLGSRYPLEIETEAFSSGIETPSDVVGRLVAEHDDRPAIVVLGGSQTWGAGVTRLDDIWTARLERSLGGGYKVWNFGISGQDAGDQIALLRELGLTRHPRLVVAVFGTNEIDPVELRRDLDALAALGREHGFSILLVEEPVAHDAPKIPRFWEYRDTIEEAGARHALPVADLHAALVRKRDRALMWWDFAHLSSHGHALFEEAIRPDVERALAAQDAPGSAATP